MYHLLSTPHVTEVVSCSCLFLSCTAASTLTFTSISTYSHTSILLPLYFCLFLYPLLYLCLHLILSLIIHFFNILYRYLILSHSTHTLYPLQIIGILDTAKASYENIFVGGFSQGGCLSLHMIRSELVTKLPEQLKGIFSMGSFLVSKSVVLQEERMISKEGNMLLDIPIFMMHGM